MKRIKEIFEEHRHRYGYRRITAQLHREGMRVNHKRVKRLMVKMHLYAITIRRRFKYSSYKGTIGKIKSNLIISQIGIGTQILLNFTLMEKSFIYRL